MHVNDLPASAHLAVTADVKEIERVLSKLVKEGEFYHLDFITDASRSGRLFLQQPNATSTSLVHPLEPRGDARELKALISNSRYDPPVRPSGTKGLEIRTLMIDGKRAVLIWAAWVG